MCDAGLILPTGKRFSWRPGCAGWLGLVLMFGLPFSSFSQNGVVLTNLAQVRALSLLEGAKGIPVSVRATITYIDPAWQMLFVQDESGSSYVESSFPVNDPSWNLQAGEIVDVEGITSAGITLCNVREQTLRPVGSGPLPKPLVLSSEESFKSTPDARWVKATGVITGVQTQGRKLNFAFRAAPNRSLHLMVLQGNPVSAATLIGCTVEATGAFGLELDASNRPTGGNVLWISDLAEIQRRGALPVTPIGSLTRPGDGAASAHLARVRGNLISQSAGDFLFVRDDSGSLRVNYHAATRFGEGSPVEVFGYPAWQESAVVLNDAAVSLLNPEPQPEASQSIVTTPTAANSSLPALTQAVQVRNLPANEAARGYPVRITGVLTYSDPTNGLQFVQDRTGGIFVDGKQKKFDSFPEAGRLVEITGFSGPGDYAPVIEAVQLRSLGESALPKPKAVSMQVLMTGTQDSQWIILNGVVRSQSVQDNATVLSLATGDSVVNVTAPNAAAHPAPRSYVDAWVEIRGVCGTVFDNQRHLQGITLYAPDWEQVRSWSDGPEDPFALPVRSISELLEFHPAADGLHRSHVHGTVLLRQTDGSFYVQDATGAILIQAQTAVGLVKPGQMVDLVGFPSIVNKWPVLQEAVVRGVAETSKLQPIPIAPDTALSQVFHGVLVCLQARVMSHSSGATEESLMLQFGPGITDAILEKDQPADQLGQVKPGSVVELTGVYLAQADDNRTVQSFQLMLRSPHDVRVLSRPAWWTAQRTLWLFAALATSLALVLTWVTALRKQVYERTRELRAEIEERKRMEAQVATTHKELLIASRGAGMAEVATSVLHNVGNVLNSVNVSANLIVEATKASDLTGLAKVSALLREHASDLAAFLADHPKGRQLPKYLELLAERHQATQKTVRSELESLSRNINHINDIVSMQQNYAKAIGVTEIVAVTDLIEDALQMNRDALTRHDVTVARDFAPDLPEITVDKHKTLQILVNLIGNARFACQDSDRTDKNLTVRAFRRGDRLQISIADNGVGIAPENMTRIFSHGFTTRKHGHGFGLHSGALAAKEMGGTLTVKSDGPGKGAEFILNLPMQPPPQKSAPRPAASGAANGQRHSAPEIGLETAIA
jgi:signal transduction histidine kinase